MPLSNPIQQKGIYTTLFRLIGANANTTADQQLVALFPFSSYLIDRFIITNASISLTNAAGGIYTGTAKSGSVMVAASQRYSALTTPQNILFPILGKAGQNTISAPNLYLALTTPQGAPATVDIFAMGVAG